MQELLDKWNIKLNYNILLSMWNESHRAYHNQNHLLDLINQINENKSKFESHKDYEKMVLCALFHDCVYDPMSNDNEEKSAEFFVNCCQEKNQDILDIKQMILDTKTHESTTPLSEEFNHIGLYNENTPSSWLLFGLLSYGFDISEIKQIKIKDLHWPSMLLKKFKLFRQYKDLLFTEIQK